jgi:SAM-dependent methyltransferase
VTDNTIINKLRRARSRYAEEWSAGNARTFSHSGHYAWMAKFLAGRPRVLEVGIGDGRSTQALLDAGHVVIGIDENPACLDLARQHLKNKGQKMVHEKRERVEMANSSYKIQYAPPKSTLPPSGALLLEGDILDDPSLLEWLSKECRPDAIVCWLMGTYFERALNKAVADLAISDPANYRCKVHEQVYRYAESILPEGGMVHIVDRSLLVPSENGDLPGSAPWLATCREFYETQIKDTTLCVSTLDFIAYKEPDNGPAIGLTHSIDGHNPDAADKAFISVVFHKKTD